MMHTFADDKIEGNESAWSISRISSWFWQDFWQY